MKIVYSHPKCTTCKKALKWLDDHQISYQLKDIREERPSAKEFLAIQKRLELPIKKMFNTSGMMYRELQLKDKLAEMSPTEATELLAKEGMLVKRPLMVEGDVATFGFKEDTYQQIWGK